MEQIAPDSLDVLLAFRVRGDDGILAEVMMAEVDPSKPDKPNKADPVLEHFVELRKYIEHSHDGLSKRLEKVEGGQQNLEAGQQRLEGNQERLERKVDGGLERLERRIDGGLERLEGKVDAGLQRLEAKVDEGLHRLDGKVDGGFDRLARKIDSLTPVRRRAPRRRKP